MKLFKNKNLLIAAAMIVAAVTALIAFAFSDPGKEKKPVAVEKAVETAAPVRREFGLPLDSFSLVHATIQRNEFLANILQRYGVDYSSVAKLMEKSRDVFDVRNLSAGNPYTVFCSNDSAHTACYFVYQPNPVDYIVYDLSDSIRVYSGRKAVSTKTRTVAGVIKSSLYETLEKENTDPMLTMKLANVFAWTIDFYAIQEGDWFKVDYEENYVDDKPVNLGQIRAAVFHHDGETFRAFYFQPNSSEEGNYYDEHAKSLRKAFLKAPLKFFHITSHYSLRRFHPVQHQWKAHLGTDYAAPTGTPIMSTGDGVVIASQYTRFNGNYVKIRHNATYTTQYLHMSKRAVKVGQHVSQGQVIGYVGSTGLATGPHVCYRFWKNGVQVDPMKQHFPAAEPLDQGQMPQFLQLVQQEEQKLASVGMDTVKAAS